MKKSKMFLTGVAVIVVLGGAMAVKAHSNFTTRNIYYCPATVDKCELANYNTLGVGTSVTIDPTNYYTAGTLNQTCTPGTTACGTQLESGNVFASN